MTPQPNTNRFSLAIRNFIPRRAAKNVTLDDLRTVPLSRVLYKMYEAIRNEYEGHESDLPVVLAAPQIGQDKRILVLATAVPASKGIVLGGTQVKPEMNIKFHTLMNPLVVSYESGRMTLKFETPDEKCPTEVFEGAVAQMINDAMYFLDPLSASRSSVPQSAPENPAQTITV